MYQFDLFVDDAPTREGLSVLKGLQRYKRYLSSAAGNYYTDINQALMDCVEAVRLGIVVNDFHKNPKPFHAMFPKPTHLITIGHSTDSLSERYIVPAFDGAEFDCVPMVVDERGLWHITQTVLTECAAVTLTDSLGHTLRNGYVILDYTRV